MEGKNCLVKISLEKEKLQIERKDKDLMTSIGIGMLKRNYKTVEELMNMTPETLALQIIMFPKYTEKFVILNLIRLVFVLFCPCLEDTLKN